MQHKLLGCLALTLAVGATAPARAQERPPAAHPRRGGSPKEITPETQEAIARGLEFLASEQNRWGGWTRATEYPIAVTALCGLALLAGGSTPSAGPYAENVRAAMSFILERQQRTGVFLEGQDSRYMYGHGFSLLFLAECHGNLGTFKPRLTPGRTGLDQAIRDAIGYTATWQSYDGGWYYTGTRDEDEGSVTITQIQGLRAARNAGFKVEKAVIDRAIDYIRRSQDPDGGVRYTVRSGRSSLALTGAGLAVLFGAGDYDSKNVRDALEYCRAHMAMGPETGHFHYTHFYLAQALHQQGGADWDRYFPQIRQELLRTRTGRGAWSAQPYGQAYATALSLLILEIPYRYLPIYER